MCWALSVGPRVSGLHVWAPEGAAVLSEEEYSGQRTFCGEGQMGCGWMGGGGGRPGSDVGDGVRLGLRSDLPDC